jgi:annexin A7/11
MPSLNQGDLFKNSQNKFKYNVNKDDNSDQDTDSEQDDNLARDNNLAQDDNLARDNNLDQDFKSEKYYNLNCKEGFTHRNSNNNSGISNSITHRSKRVLNQTNMDSEKQNTLHLDKDYKDALIRRKFLATKLEEKSKDYFKRINPAENQYLNKNIKLGNHNMYVTNQGVAKWYAGHPTQIMGVNGCPAESNSITLDIPWDEKYARPGAIIPTTPFLITGTPMVVGQMCGNEGSNVYVDEMLQPDVTSSYVGVYGNNRVMHFIGGRPNPKSAIQNGNFNLPVIPNNSYKTPTVPGWSVFNATLMHNSRAWGYPTYPHGRQAASLQSLNSMSQTLYLQKGTYTLTFMSCGRPGYSGANTIDVQLNDTTIYTFTPSTTAWASYSTPLNVTTPGPNVVGFVGTINNVNNSSAIQNVALSSVASDNSNGTFTYDMCKQAAIMKGFKNFGLQGVNTSTSTGYCAVTNDSVGAKRYGQSMKVHASHILWESNTGGGKGVSTSLTSQGALSVYDSTGKVIFSTPNDKAVPSNYIGCYVIPRHRRGGGGRGWRRRRRGRWWWGRRRRREGFVGQEEGFDGQEEGFDGQEEGFDGPEEGFDGQEEGFDGQEEGFDDQEEGFDGQEEGFEDQEGFLGLFNSSVREGMAGFLGLFDSSVKEGMRFGKRRRRKRKKNAGPTPPPPKPKTCQEQAKDKKHAYSFIGEKSACRSGNNLNRITRSGRATNCTKVGTNSYIGGGNSMAIYNTAASSSMYWLTVSDDGTMVVLRGQTKGDNQGLIWNAGTENKSKGSNPMYRAKRGKYGVDYMKSGQTLAPGDFIGSADGRTGLIMETDGNLVLYAWTMVPNSDTMGDGNTGGGSGATSLYELSANGIMGNMGKLGYIDANSHLHEFPARNFKHTTNYKEFTNVDTEGHDIKNAAYTGATADQCAKTCNSLNHCAGFVLDTNTGKCWPKNRGMYPHGDVEMKKGFDTYVRSKTPRRAPLGAATSDIFHTDTVTFQRYLHGGKFAKKYGLARATSRIQDKIDNTESLLDGLVKQMGTLSSHYISNTDKINHRIHKNIDGSQKYLSELDGTTKEIKTMGPGINSILNNSDIAVLQKNYDYLFWSILATGTIIVSMNVVKK